MAKPKVKRLKIADALDRLDEMIPLIVRDVEIAIQTEAALETANELVNGDELRGANFYGADCYNAVKLSMSIFLALTLAKLFETPGLWRGKSQTYRFNNSDIASIPLMIRLLKQARCRKHLSKRARDWTPSIPGMAETNAEVCERAIDRATEAYATLRSKHAGRNAAAKLRLFRNKAVAHTLLGTALKSAPLYRELFLLMDVARDVAEQSRLAIDGIHIDLRETEEEQMNISRAFWRPALTASAKAGRGDGD
jgi:hypothetical protein